MFRFFAFLARVPLLGDVIEFIYGAVLLAAIVGTPMVWTWGIASLIAVELALVGLLLFGYFWLAKRIKAAGKSPP